MGCRRARLFERHAEHRPCGLLCRYGAVGMLISDVLGLPLVPWELAEPVGKAAAKHKGDIVGLKKKAVTKVQKVHPWVPRGRRSGWGATPCSELIRLEPPSQSQCLMGSCSGYAISPSATSPEDAPSESCLSVPIDTYTIYPLSCKYEARRAAVHRSLDRRGRSVMLVETAGHQR